MAGNVAADLVVHVGADTKDAESGLDSVGNKVNNTGKGFKTAGLAMMGIGAAAVGGLGLAVNSAMNFEQSLADINAVADLTDQEMGQVKGLALQIGKDTVFSATEGAQAIGELVKAGVPLDDVLNGAAMSAANLASAGGISVPEAATAMANAMNVFGISGENSTQVADTFAAAANASSGEVNDFTAALAQGGPSAAAWGLTIQDTTAGLALFANAGIKGSDAGTSLKTMLMGLTPQTDEQAAAFAAMGFSADEFASSAHPLEYLAGKLQTGLKDMSVAQRQATLEMLFGSDAARVANILYEEGAEGVANMTEEVSKTGVAQQMAAKRMDTLKGSIEQLKGSFETAMIIIGTGFIPIIRAVADGINGLVGMFLSLPGPIQKIIGFATAAGAIFLLLAGALAYAASFLPGLAIGFGILLSPIALLIAAIGLLVAAFATDFMGIRSKVMDTIGPIVDGLKKMGTFIGALADGDLKKIGKSFSALPKAMKPFGNVLFAASIGVRKFVDTLKKDGLIDALKGLPDDFGPAISNFKAFGQQIEDTLKNINWDSLLIKAVMAASQLKNAFVGLAGKIANNLGNLAAAVGGWIAKNGPGIASAIGNGLQAAASVAGDIASKIADGLGDLAAAVGGWIAKNAPAIGTAIRNGLEAAASTAVDIAGTIVSKLGDLAGRFADWVQGAASGINWGALADGAYDIASTIIGKLGDLADKFSTWVTDGGASADWSTLTSRVTNITKDVTTKLGNLGEALKGWIDNAGIVSGISDFATTLANKVTDAAPGIIEKLGDLGTELKTWYDNAIESVDWGSMGETIGSKVGSMAMILWEKGSQLVEGLRNGFINNWQTIVTAVGVAFLSLPATIGYLGSTLGPKAIEFLQGFVDGLNVNWGIVIGWGIGFPMKVGSAIGSLLATLAPKALELLLGFISGLDLNWTLVSTWLTEIGTKAVTAVSDLSTTLLQKGSDLISGLFKGVGDFWDASVAPWLQTMGQLIFQTVGSLADTLVSRGTELINGFFNTGINDAFEPVSNWFINLGMLIYSTVGSLLSTLVSRGNEAIQGLYTGILTKWTVAASFLYGLGSKISNAVGDLGGLLVAAGSAVVQGLIDGIVSMGESLASAAGGLKDIIEAHKGPMSYDKIMLVPAGKAIVSSLINGMQSQEKHLIAQSDRLTAMVSHIGSDFALADLNAVIGNNDALLKVDRNTTINQTVYVNARFDEVEDMIRAAQFVKELNPARKIYVDVLR